MRLGKKVRTQGRSVGQTTSYGNSQFVEDEEELPPIVIGPPFGGINNPDTLSLYAASSNLEDNEFQALWGLFLHENTLKSIANPVISTPTKPNSNKILGLVNINNAGSITGLRFTKTTVHKLVSGVFTAITGGALTGGDYDRFHVLYVEGRTFFNNNGINVLQEANLTANTYAAAGNARRYKYYVVCNRRIIGANLLAGTNDPTEVAGCGDRNYTEWDPTVDISAFRGSLIDTEGTSTDEITGLASADDDRLIVFRSNSIWIGYPQPIASAPFNFKKVSHYGCNASYSIQEVEGGVIWYDPFKKNVFFLDYKTEEVSFLGDKVKEDLVQTLGDPQKIFSSYDAHNSEYELCYEFSGGNIARIYRYNRSSKTWTYQELDKGSCLSNDISLEPTVTIDGLGGTPIDSLSGTIDALSENALRVSKIFGLNDGDRVTLIDYFNNVSAALQTKVFREKKYKQFVDFLEIRLGTSGFVTMHVLFYNGFDVINHKTLVFTSGGTKVIKIPIRKTVECFRLDLDWIGAAIHIHSMTIYRKLAGLI